MITSRIVIVAFFLAVNALVFATAQSTTDPPLYCSVFSFQPYSVVVGTAPDPDHLGIPLAPEVHTTYGMTTYFITLSQQVTDNHLFLDLNNSNNGNVTFTVEWGIVGPNNEIITPRYILDASGNPMVFHFNNSGWQVELFPFSAGGVNNRTYEVIVNLTQVIIGPNGGRVDGCNYVDYFFITNPGSGSGSTGGFVVGDPQFVGLRGQSFQVHGIDGAVYNLISDRTTQLNARFSFLNGPRQCPIMPSTGTKATACWSHPGSYLSELGLKTIDGDRLLVVAGNAGEGFDTLTLNGKNMQVGETAKLHSNGFVTFNSTHELTLHANQFTIAVENIDGFVNLRHIAVTDWKSLSSHGLLGQTWNTKKYNGKIRDIEGEVDDYVILSDDIFGDEFVFNKYPLSQ